MGTGIGAYPMLPQKAFAAPGNFLCCLWSIDSKPTRPKRTYTRKIPLISLNDIYQFNQKEITFPVRSMWLSVMNNKPFLVIETQ